MLEQSPEGAEAADALAECSTLVELLEARQVALTATLEGAFPELRATIWQSEASVQAAVQVCCAVCWVHVRLLDDGGRACFCRPWGVQDACWCCVFAARAWPAGQLEAVSRQPTLGTLRCGPASVGCVMPV